MRSNAMFAVILSHKAVKSGLVTLGGTLGRLIVDPGVKLVFERIDIPAPKIGPHAG